MSSASSGPRSQMPLEDRVSAGEDRAVAEKAVLEGLGDPVRLAAGISGRPLYLIGPDLFVQYRQLLVMLLSIVMPIVGIVQVVVAHFRRGRPHRCPDGRRRWSVDRRPPHLLLGHHHVRGRRARRCRSRRAGRDQRRRRAMDRRPAAGATFRAHQRERPGGGGAEHRARDRRPPVPQQRRLVHRCRRRPDPALQPRPVEPLHSDAGCPPGGHRRACRSSSSWWADGRCRSPPPTPCSSSRSRCPSSRWRSPARSSIPSFAEALGWPPLADARGPAMLGLAAAAVLVTAWDIYDAFRRARRADARATGIGEPGQAAR